MKKATALLLNWKRPENMHRLIKSIRDQEADIQIFLWNNNIEDTQDYDADVRVNSEQNFYCWPRWLMGSLTDTEFIFTIDDDLFLKDPKFIDQCMGYLNGLSSDTILGITGVILNENKDYWRSKHIIESDGSKDVCVDIIKGRFMFMRSEFLDTVTLEFRNKNTRGDDIYISSFSQNKIIPKLTHGAWRNLPEGSESLYRQPEHNALRQKMVDKMFRGSK